MQAFRSVRAEMRQAIDAITHPGMPPGAGPMRRGPEEDEEDGEVSHIEPWMELSFRALTHASETNEPFALISCFMNGKPAALIAATRTEGSSTHVLPLFLAVQPWMKFGSRAEDTSSDAAEESELSV